MVFEQDEMLLEFNRDYVDIAFQMYCERLKEMGFVRREHAFDEVFVFFCVDCFLADG